MLKIAISGSTGRMGLALINAISKDKDFKLIGGVASESNSNIGKDLGNNSGPKPMADYLTWCETWLKECIRILKPKGMLWIHLNLSTPMELMLCDVP